MNTPPIISGANEAKNFPKCDANGPNVDAKAFIQPKTGLAVTLGAVVLVLFILISIVVFYIGIAVLIGLLIDYFRRQKALAHLKGSSIEIGDVQFPEIYVCVQTIVQRLGMKETPAIYLVEGNTINAAAMRLAGRRVVVLIDDIVYACLSSGEPRTLSFIIGHELAHHALGHTGYFRFQLSRMMKWLSRLDEFSCDAVANQIVGDPSISAKALTVLLSGPQMLPYVNTTQLIQQARQVEADKKSKKAEKHLTHPLLLRRLYRFVN
ncbi:MAG TPA: M48 family metallopeptidase [Verrucomicrobiae bacterium]|nr:M48 family metallopeptidase [Verrucomicrobiae bacterium]